MKKINENECKIYFLQVLKKIDKICKDNNINYYLAYGTFLGAVRHKGFIPWDDDIDILILRNDYNKLKEIIENGDFGLNFLDVYNCPETIYSYGKVCDTNTLLVENNFKKVPGLGAFVDVFPMDYLPNDVKKRKRFERKSLFLQKLITHSARTGYDKTTSKKKNFLRCIAFIIGKFINTRKAIIKLDKFNQKYNKTTTNFIGVPWSKSYPSYLFKETDLFEFEKNYFLGPKNYDEVLKITYGNYLELPPIEHRIFKHDFECFLIGEDGYE